MEAVLQNLGCPVSVINSVEDHVHVLFDLSRTVSVSGVAEAVKRSSSRWLKTQGPEFISFSWQAGYGAFAVSRSDVPKVRQYILRQAEHHRQLTFQDEYRQALLDHGIFFNEVYLWD
jgi:REP element-mobilizing transposase RayT